MENLKFCVLQECNEIEAIVNANDEDDGDVILHSLEYLSVHYQRNLRSIWKGQSLPWFKVAVSVTDSDSPETYRSRCIGRVSADTQK